MAKVEIYSKAYCPYCQGAKALLAQKGIVYHEYDLLKEPQQLAVMLARSKQQRTVPQIFINDEHIGGFSELQALQRSGELDQLLSMAEAVASI